MYAKWAKARGVACEVIEWTDDLPREVTFCLAAPLEMFLGEPGIHRLTRVSPFGDGRVHTSFVRLEAMTLVPERRFAGLKDGDIKAEYFRSGGNGGQNAQKTCTAVRIKHIPTGLTASCQAERSQVQNYRQALAVLATRVEEAEKTPTAGSGTTNCWGEAFRSYVLNGKLRVKDRRSGYETASVQRVLDGEIEGLLTFSSMAGPSGE